ncbi:acyl-CoA dehydrogenase family protein [Burkholderia glumae]|uniref:acyl-CoA dehydrogenase family protein n=2 Tax=Burkholderia glumae TaxID=337 RepID=UPI0020CBEAB8|nr:acyl-CoA dehydrogenase family protein [Burkholderia glumae]MCQ0033497.1 monooxygenase [Burkholderia glumae]
MSSPSVPLRSAGADYDALAARFRPVFARIASGAVERDRHRTLPVEAIGWLRQAGFGALRVPTASGGLGASIPQLLRLLIELAAADSNLPQALRGHFAFVEDWLNAPPGAARDTWLARFAAGQLVGNAWSETGEAALGEARTRVSRRDQGWVVNGEKFYTTGSLFADWIDVYAQREADGAPVIAAVATAQPGVTLVDDWDGFGQRTTGSGTTRFTEARVDPHGLIDFSRRFRYQTAFYQLFHLATLAGIARAAERDAGRLVRERKRIYSHGNAARAGDDPQILQVVGEVASWAYAAEAITLRAAEPAQRAYELHDGAGTPAEHAANVAAELESAQAQVVVTDLVLRAATHLFDALGASATRGAAALDRHWRNARTVASHNPVVYKARIVGAHSVDGTEPPTVWKVGVAPEGAAHAGAGTPAKRAAA